MDKMNKTKQTVSTVISDINPVTPNSRMVVPCSKHPGSFRLKGTPKGKEVLSTEGQLIKLQKATNLPLPMNEEQYEMNVSNDSTPPVKSKPQNKYNKKIELPVSFIIIEQTSKELKSCIHGYFKHRNSKRVGNKK